MHSLVEGGEALLFIQLDRDRRLGLDVRRGVHNGALALVHLLMQAELIHVPSRGRSCKLLRMAWVTQVHFCYPRYMSRKTRLVNVSSLVHIPRRTT